MFRIKYVTEQEENYWFTMDHHVTRQTFDKKVRDKQGYVIFEDEKPIGIMHYNLFWDKIPFLNLIMIEKEYRRRGYGGKAMKYWEAEMLESGFQMVLLSTQTDEDAQHFYRKSGYKDCGCLILNDCPLEQPAELFMCKTLDKDN